MDRNNRVKYIPTHYGVQGDQLFDGIASAAQDIAKSISGIGVGEKPKPKGKGDAKSKPKAESKLNSSKETIQAIAATAKSCREDYNRSSLKKLVHYMRVALTAIAKEKNLKGALKDHTNRLAALYKVLIDNIKEAKMRENYDNLDEFLDDIIETVSAKIPRSQSHKDWKARIKSTLSGSRGVGRSLLSVNQSERDRLAAEYLMSRQGTKGGYNQGINHLRKEKGHWPSRLVHGSDKNLKSKRQLKNDELIGILQKGGIIPRREKDGRSYAEMIDDIVEMISENKNRKY